MQPVGDVGGEEDAEEEGQASRGIRAPGNPTDEERDSHSRNHIPYRSLCDICVRARGRADPHHSRGAENRYSEAQVSADYWFLGRQSAQGRDGIPVLVIYERVRRVLYAHVVPSKGLTRRW